MHYVCIALSRRESEVRHSLIRATLGIFSSGNLVHGARRGTHTHTRARWHYEFLVALCSHFVRDFSFLFFIEYRPPAKIPAQERGKLIANATRRRDRGESSLPPLWKRSIGRTLRGILISWQGMGRTIRRGRFYSRGGEVAKTLSINRWLIAPSRRRFVSLRNHYANRYLTDRWFKEFEDRGL